MNRYDAVANRYGVLDRLVKLFSRVQVFSRELIDALHWKRMNETYKDLPFAVL